MGIEKKNFTFRLDEDLVEKLRAYAKGENRNLSNMVETILRKSVAALPDVETSPKKNIHN